MNDTNAVDVNDLMRYGYGEHLKGKDVVLDEGLMNKSIAVSYKYYDTTKKVILRDCDGNIISTTWW